MHESIGAALDSLKQSEGTAVDITHPLHGLTLSIVGRAAFGECLPCMHPFFQRQAIHSVPDLGKCVNFKALMC